MKKFEPPCSYNIRPELSPLNVRIVELTVKLHMSKGGNVRSELLNPYRPLLTR